MEISYVVPTERFARCMTERNHAVTFGRTARDRFGIDSTLERNGLRTSRSGQIGNGFAASSKWGRSIVGPTV